MGCMEWNGMERTGMGWNGVIGMKWNEMEWNGMGWNGMKVLSSGRSPWQLSDGMERDH